MTRRERATAAASGIVFPASRSKDAARRDRSHPSMANTFDIVQKLWNLCNILPTGIFYAQGVKTNVLFFTRGATETGNTKEVWVYDLRANMPTFGKRSPLTREHFAEFEKAFGADPRGGEAALKKRKDGGVTGRFRKFTREEIAKRDDSLDLSWLKDENAESVFASIKLRLARPSSRCRFVLPRREERLNS